MERQNVTEDEDGFTLKYWICRDCAKKNKWGFPKWPVTGLINSKCGHCRSSELTTLIPVIDFDRPGQPAEWD